MSETKQKIMGTVVLVSFVVSLFTTLLVTMLTGGFNTQKDETTDLVKAPTEQNQVVDKNTEQAGQNENPQEQAAPVKELSEEELNQLAEKNKDVVVTIISDKRCTDCYTDEITNELKKTPFLVKSKFESKDFKDEGVKELLEKYKINRLPAIILSKGQIAPAMDKFLKKVGDNAYQLEINSQFNPFLERSDRGFLIIDKDLLKTIKDNSYIEGKKDAKLTWLEYSDLECPYCAKLHISSTPGEITTKYKDDINVIFNHFPLSFHKNAQKAAEALECIAEQKGGESFYAAIAKSYDKYHNNNFSLDGLYDIAEKELGVDRAKLKECVDSNKYADKVKEEMERGVKLNITGTPGNVIINNETGEYVVLPGAYPTEAFEEQIDKLLK